MNINSNLPSFFIPSHLDEESSKAGDSNDVSREALPVENESSLNLLVTAIESQNFETFTTHIGILGTDCLRKPLQFGRFQHCTPVSLMLKTMNLEFVKKAVNLFGRDILWEKIAGLNFSFSSVFPKIQDYYGFQPSEIPFVHYAFCIANPPNQTNIPIYAFLIEQLDVDALRTPIEHGEYKGLTATHFALLFSNKPAITWLKNQPSWDDVNAEIPSDAPIRNQLHFDMKMVLSMPLHIQSLILQNVDRTSYPSTLAFNTLPPLYKELTANSKNIFKSAISLVIFHYPTIYCRFLFKEISKARTHYRLSEMGAWVQKYEPAKAEPNARELNFGANHSLMKPNYSLQNVDMFVAELGILGLTLHVTDGYLKGMHALHYAALFSSFRKFEYLCNQLDELKDCLHSIPIGPFQGLNIVHLAAIGADIRNLKFLVEKLGEDCLLQPATFGPHQGKRAVDFASDMNPEKFYQFLSGADLQIPEEAELIELPSSSPVPDPTPEPIPNPIRFNAAQWITQKLDIVKKNPTPLIEEFKNSGIFDYSSYGDAFFTPKGMPGIFQILKSNPDEQIQRLYREMISNPFPEGFLDEVAGAAYYLYVSSIQQMIHKPRDPQVSNKVFLPFLVYTQQGHEIRAHIAAAIGYQPLVGLNPLMTANAVSAVKQLLGDSSYRFEEGQIVMDLEGFEKLTQEMAKPGLTLMMMPKMPEPEPFEEQPRSFAPLKTPKPQRASAVPAMDGTDEPLSMKRQLPSVASTPKRMKVTKSTPVSGGVDRRTTLTDGAKTTRFNEEERVNSSAKRQKLGKFEAVSLGKTVEMPGITLDETDPHYFFKKLMKSSLDGTLNNLKSARARSALIRREPLPMPIADKLTEIVPVQDIRTLTELKGYQLDALKRILSLSAQGVMPLLSLEMGLGKTYVFREWILQRIIAYKGGRHLIVVPASVKEQTKKVFQDCIRDLVQMLRDRKNHTSFTHEELSTFFRFPAVLVPEKKDMAAALNHEHAILIVNYEIMESLKGCMGSDQLTSIVADEAQRVHNDQSQTHNHLANLAVAQKLPTFRLMQVTATPYENDLTELWTLLSSSNPGLVPAESQKALIVGLQKLKENLVDSIQGEAIDTEQLINQYAHFKAFQKLLCKLVIYKKTTDPQVVQDWNGRIPTRTDENPEIDPAPEVLQALSNATQELIQSKNQLSFNSKSNAALIHTSLIGQSIQDENPAVQQLYRDAEQGDMGSLVEKSAFLQLLFSGTNPVLERCYKENMKALVFVDHYVTGRLIQIGAKRIYNKTVEFFNGQCSLSEKSRLTTWFEGTNEPRVLVLSMKAGGVGLNLPSARMVVDLSQEYNIAQHYQAIARAIRANNEGEVKVLTPLFRGSFYQAHVSSHQAKKARWMQFFFGDASLDSFLEAVINETRIDLLNKSKSLPQANTEETCIREALTLARMSISSDQIEEAVEMVSHTPSIPVVAAPTSLDPQNYVQIALPYGSTREDVILFAIALKNSLAKPLIERFKDEKRKVESTANFNKELMRQDHASVYARRVQQLIQFTRDNTQTELVGKDYEFRTDVHPPVFVAVDENQRKEGVYLYRKTLPNGNFHYEPLIAKK